MKLHFLWTLSYYSMVHFHLIFSPKKYHAMCGVRKINIGELIKGDTRRTGNNTSYACHAIPLRQAGSLGRWSAEACAAQALWCATHSLHLPCRGQPSFAQGQSTWLFEQGLAFSSFGVWGFVIASQNASPLAVRRYVCSGFEGTLPNFFSTSPISQAGLR